MPNPTGISRAALREAADSMRMVELIANEYYRGNRNPNDPDLTIHEMKEQAMRAEITVLRLLADVEKECC